MKKFLKSDNFEIFVNSLGFFILIFIFNKTANIYCMSTVHKFICLSAAGLSHIFFVPLYFLFNKKLKD